MYRVSKVTGYESDSLGALRKKRETAIVYFQTEDEKLLRSIRQLEQKEKDLFAMGRDVKQRLSSLFGEKKRLVWIEGEFVFRDLKKVQAELRFLKDQRVLLRKERSDVMQQLAVNIRKKTQTRFF